jgi:hypothetical protein
MVAAACPGSSDFAVSEVTVSFSEPAEFINVDEEFPILDEDIEYYNNAYSSHFILQTEFKPFRCKSRPPRDDVGGNL